MLRSALGWIASQPQTDTEEPAPVADSFVHLHVHTEYSMLDGAAKNGKLVAEAERQGMPAIAMSDHGNMFGAYEFFQKAKDSAVKPIIGIEAYVAPHSRFEKKPVFWSPAASARRAVTVRAARTSPVVAATPT